MKRLQKILWWLSTKLCRHGSDLIQYDRKLPYLKCVDCGRETEGFR